MCYRRKVSACAGYGVPPLSPYGTWNVSVAHEMKGLIALHRKEYDEARTLFEKAVHAYRETGASFNVIIQKSNLAHMERELGKYALALDIYRETIVAFRDVGQRSHTNWNVLALSHLHGIKLNAPCSCSPPRTRCVKNWIHGVMNRSGLLAVN